MRVYVSSRFDNTEQVREVNKMVLAKGWELAFDWTQFQKIDVIKNISISRSRSSTEIISILDSHAFILINCDDGCGMYVELGAAITSCLKTGHPLIYVTGDHLDRSIFFYHPAVKVMENIEDIFEDITQVFERRGEWILRV